MLSIYKTSLTNNLITEVDSIENGCWINLVNPTNEEITMVCQQTKINREFIDDSLDRDERPRYDYEEDDGTKFILIDVPFVMTEQTLEQKRTFETFNTIPLGIIIVRDELIITVSLEDTKVINRFKTFHRNFSTKKKTRFVLQLFTETATNYITCLKALEREKRTAEEELSKSYKNKNLRALLDIQKSLMYFETSLKTNTAVMDKILKGTLLTIYQEDDTDVLEDAIIENKQALEMTQIQANVLESTMNVYGSMMSNNLSYLMKFLTSVTIFISIPTMIAGFFGMNVIVPMSDNPFMFWGIVIISMLISLIVSLLISRRR